MNKKLFLMAITLSTCLHVGARQLTMQTPHISLVVQADEGQTPQYVYFGSRLSSAMLTRLPMPSGGDMDAYPAYGLNCPSEAALCIKHADGNMSTELRVIGSEQNNNVTTIHLADPVYPIKVDLKYKTYDDVDMIETWTEISNNEKGTVTLLQFASGVLPIRHGNVWASYLQGFWANEAQVIEEPLKGGQLVISNRDGVRNSQTDHAEVMFSLNGKPQENAGNVIGAALCYSGNYLLNTVTDWTDYHHFFAGIDPKNSAYQLRRGQTFSTPHLALTFSKEGLSGVSRNFHRWGRKYMLRHGNQERMILLNSWEGVYLNVNQAGMAQMMKDIADMGGELFVMDDGWFGNKYDRNVDNAALGDWVVDKRKLPDGIEGLLREAKKNNIKFGIWIEPEMTNTKSELYEKHPDWVVKAPKRDLVKGRGGTQLVLDLSNPKVQDFVFGVVDNLMTKYPEIAYIKWDANMSIMNHGSQYLPMVNQSELYIAYHQGFEKVCKRIREKYPNLIIQACASGGGRANWGVLPWFDEFWTSDDTDALQRIYIQWGTSYFFPAIAMGAHISASPNHQMGRIVPLKYRIDVAMSGRLGMEIQPATMSDEDKAFCKKAISEYKQIRPIVQLGDIYRLQSPFEKTGLASLMYVDEKKDKAVFFWWKTESFMYHHLPRVRMAGLDPEKMYTVHEIDRIDTEPLWCEGKQFSGAYLMEKGLEMPSGHHTKGNKMLGWSSRVLLME